MKPILVAIVLCWASGCGREPERSASPVKPSVVLASGSTPTPAPSPKDSDPSKGDKPSDLKIILPEKDDEPWPEPVDEPPVPPKPLDAKVIDVWKAAGAKTGWQTQVQFFDAMPDVKRYPEMLPYLSFRPFKPGLSATLSAPDQPFAFYLYGSGFKDEQLKELTGLKTLRKLDLTANFDLTGAGFSELAKLPDLQELYLYQTGLKDSGLKEVCQIKTLRHLDIGVTGVTVAGLPQLVNLKKLRVLGVHNIRMTDEGLQALARCQHLRELALARISQTGAGMKALGKLKYLETMTIAGVFGNSLKDGDLKGIAALQNLRTLRLNGNGDFTDAGLEHLVKLPCLEVLELDRTKITDAGCKLITTFESEKLRSVRLPATVSKAALAEASKARPKVSFKHWP